jgi:hypothetical protein
MALRRLGARRDDRGRIFSAGGGVGGGRPRPEPWVAAPAHQGARVRRGRDEPCWGFGGGAAEQRRHMAAPIMGGGGREQRRRSASLGNEGEIEVLGRIRWRWGLGKMGGGRRDPESEDRWLSGRDVGCGLRA